ncbi:filamentous hemagglutinin N-terminal domain-containing protein [Salmonella enterica subsp. enterica serovar Aqua]|uniref:Filamentous hemagglutinin N-terminal domain-containing protein n=2 Tax=Salmonella enterica TaxID=28901 RepID=A0A5X6ER45_SALET|nr:filamentous hemagglutinin N-terminal domain-containing protein [Salmonella enterica subsp. enterica serovar Aqua]
MNKIYRLKFDRRRNRLVVVSELTTGAGKATTGRVAGVTGLQDISTFRKLPGILTPLAFITALAVSLLPGMALANPDLPAGGQVVAGQGSISTSGNRMTINQSTHGLVTNWNSFDIGRGHTVQFVQPDSSAVALNRVTGGHESQILGTLTANGQVMLVNPAGVMFGKGAKVNTAGLLASTKNIRTEDFMAGRYTFSGGSAPGAQVVNQGSLATTKDGYIVLAADRVRNSGTLTAPSGRVVLAAADKVTLQLDNTGLASVSVNGSVVNALVENHGLISATGGQVYLTAKGKDMLLNTVVNNRGTVEARGLTSRGGEIVLDGGESGVVSQSGLLLADSRTGRGGKITVQGQNIHLVAGSKTSATGKTGGGEVYVGGGWQGKDSHIRNASKVVTDRHALIDVSATENGNGGTAVLWSEDYTNFRGMILAKGGTRSGNGGRVETSSRHNLQAFGDVDASALKGRGGNWLLDPLDVDIVTGDNNTSVKETGKGTEAKLDSDTDHVFSPSAQGAKVSATKINEQLNSGTNVTVETHGAEGAQSGNITVSADITKTGGGDATLTLKADKDITVNKNITATSATSKESSTTATNGKLNIVLLGGGTTNGTVRVNSSLGTNGGDLTIGAVPGGGESGGEAAHIVNVNLTSNSNITASNVSISGVSTNTTEAVYIHGKIDSTDSINISASGKTTVNGATLKAQNNITINSTVTDPNGSQGDKGLGIYNSTLTATNGNISLTGNTGKTASVAVKGLSVTGSSNTSTTLNALNGTINLTGQLNSKNTDAGSVFELMGIFNTGNLTLNGQLVGNKGQLGGFSCSTINNAAGSLNISATRGNLNFSGNMTASNNLSLTTTNGEINIEAGSNLHATNGNISLNGNMSVSGISNTISLKNANITADKGDITLMGLRNNGGGRYQWGSGGPEHALSYRSGGVFIRGGNLTATGGNISLSGTATYTGVDIAGASLNAKRLINVTAMSAGVVFSSTNLSLLNIGDNTSFKAANISIQNTNGTFTPVGIAFSGTVGLNATDSLSISGDGRAYYGVQVANGTKLNLHAGNVSVTGNVSYTDQGFIKKHNGLYFGQNAAVNITSTGQINLTGKVNDLEHKSGNLTGISLENASLKLMSPVVNLEGSAGRQGILNTGTSTMTVDNTTKLTVKGQGVKDGSTGFDLRGLTLTGENADNLTLQSGGSNPGVKNYLDKGVIGSDATLLALTKKGFDNPVNMDVSGLSDSKYVKGGKVDIATLSAALQGKDSAMQGGNIVIDMTNIGNGLILSLNNVVQDTGDIIVKGLKSLNGLILEAKQGSVTVSGGSGGLTATGNLSIKAKLSVNVTAPEGDILFDYNHLPEGQNITLSGGAGVNITADKGNVIFSGKDSGSDIKGINHESGNVTVSGGSGLDLKHVNLVLNKGSIALNSGRGDLTLTDSTIQGQNITAKGALKGVASEGKTLVLNASDSLDISSPEGTVEFTARPGASDDKKAGTISLLGGKQINISAVNNSLAFSGHINMSSPDSILTGGNRNGSGGIRFNNATMTYNGSKVVAGGHSAAGTGIVFTGNNVVDGHDDVTYNGTSATGAGVTFNNGTLGGSVKVTGQSASGSGVLLSGHVTLDESTVNQMRGHSESGQGISLADAAIHVNNGKVPATLSGFSQSGSGTGVSGNSSLDGVKLQGDSGDGGYGVLVNGHLEFAGRGAGINIHTTGKGSGLLLKNAVLTGEEVALPTELLAVSNDGSAIVVEGETTLKNVRLNGESLRNGAGIVLKDGHVTGGDITGSSDSGEGVRFSGDSTLKDVSVTGHTATGTGVNVHGDLTSAGGTEIHGTATGDGTGMSLGPDITVTDSKLYGESRSGAGVKVESRTRLRRTLINGKSAGGSGAVVNGEVSSDAGSAIAGNSGTGAGVLLNGSLTGGALTGHSGSGAGMQVTGNSQISGVNVNASSEEGTALQVNGELSTTGGSLNGQGLDNSSEKRQQVHEIQNRLSQNGHSLKQVLISSGYREQGTPVKVEICTDGQCRSLDAGMKDKPSRP